MTLQTTSSRDPARLLVIGRSESLRAIVRDLISTQSDWLVDDLPEASEALPRLQSDGYDAVMVDLGSANGSGDLLEEVRAWDQVIPMLAVTDNSRAGAHTESTCDDRIAYLSRTEVGSRLRDVLDQLLRRSGRNPSITRIEQRTDYSQGLLLLDNDRQMVPAAVQHLTDQLDGFRLLSAHQRMTVAIAIEEALLNAIIHGNLEVSSELREGDDDAYVRLIERRRRQPIYRDRRVRVSYRLSSREGQITIRDEGPGFDVAAVPDPTDDENLTRPSGRGILLMTMFLDEVCYNDRGNEVTLVKRRPAQQVCDSRSEIPVAAPEESDADSAA